MDIIKLDSSHQNMVRGLFHNDKYMGVAHNTNYFIDKADSFVDFYHENFCTTYLNNLKNFHAYGIIEDNQVTAYLAFYESVDDASWYWNQVRTVGNNTTHIKHLLDKAIEHNESQGKFKFYSMFPKKYTNVYRRLAFSKQASDRYDYFDEFSVDAKHQCVYTLPWQILYNRTLVPVDTVVRCTFLKQQYRNELFNAGGL
jgi:hypothetical protein